MDYVTDTHSLVWFFTRDKSLSQVALSTFRSTMEAGRIIVPATVLAEIIHIYQKGRIKITFGETVNRLERSACFEIAPLSLEILKIVDKISKDLEMHDKLIVATAIYFDMSLITKDEKITKTKIVNVVW